MEEKEVEFRLEEADKLLSEARELIDSVERELGGYIKPKNKIIRQIKNFCLIPGRTFLKPNKEGFRQRLVSDEAYQQLCDKCKEVITIEDYKNIQEIRSIFFWTMILFLIAIAGMSI